MSIITKLTRRAILLSKAGKKLDARQILKEILRQEPRNEIAWLWYADTFPDKKERIVALQLMLHTFPNHPIATRALASLEEIPQKKARVVPIKKQPARPANFIAPVILLIGICAMILGGAGLINIIRYNMQISDLETENTKLNNQVVNLSNQVSSLNTRYQDLLTTHQKLETDYQALKAIAILPPYISVTNRRMIIGFTKTDQTNDRWEVEFQALEDELQRGNLARDSIDNDNSMWVRLKNNSTGELYDVVDMTRFVDPSSFAKVIPELYEQAGNDDKFIYEVWHIVTQLATYSGEITETPRYPLETFLAGGGDCEDTAILFSSMILAAPVKWDVELVYMDSDHPTNPQGVNHVAVFIDTGSQKYLVETTEGESMQPFTNGVTGWYFQVP